MAARNVNGRWVVEFMFRGQRVFRRLPEGRTGQDAKILEGRLRTQIFDAVDLGRLPDPLLSKVIEARGWKDKKAKSHVDAVLEQVAEYRLSQAGEARDKLVKAWPDLASGTVNRRISVIKAACKYAFRKKWTKTNLSAEVEMLPEPTYMRREVHPDMAHRLIQAASTARAKALIAASAFTGMRLSEVLRIDPKKDVQDGALKVFGKNGEWRMVPILPELEPHLGQFPIKSGWRNVYRGFERAREKAGLTIRYHDLRHMAATAMVNAGVDSRLIGDILGHKSIQTTRKYTHPSIEAKKRALGAITAGLHQGDGKKKPRKRGS